MKKPHRMKIREDTIKYKSSDKSCYRISNSEFVINSGIVVNFARNYRTVEGQIRQLLQLFLQFRHPSLAHVLHQLI